MASSTGLHGEIAVPGDKSISHRALILAAMAEGKSQIEGLSTADDVMRTLRAIEQLGVVVRRGGSPWPPESNGQAQGPAPTIEIISKGFSNFHAPTPPIDCGNSGTTMRLLLGVLAGCSFESVLLGDASLDRRPMDRVIEPLTQMGARFEIKRENNRRVIRVLPATQRLRGIVYDVPVASAQVKSALLLAALNADGEMSVSEPTLSRDHTERMLEYVGVDLRRGARLAPAICLRSQALRPYKIVIPNDPSSAAFWIVAALLVPNSEITLPNLCLNPTRVGFLNVLDRMGANYEIRNQRDQSGEPVGDLVVRYTPRLKATDIVASEIPSLIDELPILALAFAAAEGQSLVSGAQELRVKESDRIKTIVREFTRLGINAVERDDGFVVTGKSPNQKSLLDVSENAVCSTAGDHRIAMTLAIAGLVANRSFALDDVSCVATSYPGFFEMLPKYIL